MSFELRPESMRRGARCDGGCAVVAWHHGGKLLWLLKARSFVHAAADVGEAPLPMLRLCTWLRWDPMQHRLSTSDSVLKGLLLLQVAGGSCCGASHLFKGKRDALWHITYSGFEPWFFPLLSCLHAVVCVLPNKCDEQNLDLGALLLLHHARAASFTSAHTRAALPPKYAQAARGVQHYSRALARR